MTVRATCGAGVPERVLASGIPYRQQRHNRQRDPAPVKITPCLPIPTDMNPSPFAVAARPFQDWTTAACLWHSTTMATAAHLTERVNNRSGF